jgi:hypothetical protein
LKVLVLEIGRRRPEPRGVERCALVIAVAALLPESAAATSMEVSVAESGRCQRLRSIAMSEAAVLGHARLELQGFRQPSIGLPVLPGDVPAQLEQIRTGVSWSPIDRWRGVRLVEAADWECVADDARARLMEVVDQGDRYGRAAGLRAALASIDPAIEKAVELLSRATERQRRGIDTLFELDALRSRLVALRLKREQWSGELAGLEAVGTSEAAVPLSPLLRTYEEASLAAERARSQERSLESWRADLRAGAVPWPRPDWFGTVSIAWSTGGPSQAAHERRAMEGRSRELAGSTEEVRHRVKTFEEAIRRTRSSLEAELSALRDHAVYLRGRLSSTPAEDDYRKLVDALSMESMEVDARAQLLESLLSTRRALLEGEAR